MSEDEASKKPVYLRRIKGRGALSNRQSRYLGWHTERDPDEDSLIASDRAQRGQPSRLKHSPDQEISKGAKAGESDVISGDDAFFDGERRPNTQLFIDHAKTIISGNRSPDVPFDRSINPYKGCEHGCVYCFARPTHAYLDLSPGLDFETKIFYKPDGPRLLEETLRSKRYQCQPIALGTNTDPYQPIDQELQITRQLLQVLQAFRHPFTMVTKGNHLLRDLDIYRDMAADNLCSVMISITSLDNGLKRILEPRTASPASRLRTMSALAEAGVPVGAMLAPMIPKINDEEMEGILEAVAKAGAKRANYIFVRLPLEVQDLFQQWLHEHFPDRAQHVLSLIQQSRDGKLNHSEFGTRMRGTGVFAEVLRHRFRVACRRLGLNQQEFPQLDCSRFKAPLQAGDQMSLW